MLSANALDLRKPNSRVNSLLVKKFRLAMVANKELQISRYFMRNILLALILVIMPLMAHAQCVGENLIEQLTSDQRAELQRRIDASPFPEGNIWRAQRGDQILHVVGTMHLGNDRFDPLIERVRPIVMAADHIFLESSRQALTDLQEEMARDPAMLFISNGPTLIDRLAEKDWQILSTRLEQRGIPGFLAAKMQPWYAMMMLSIPACAVQAFSAEDGIDNQIMDIADASGIPMHSLEDPLETLQLLAGNTPEQQMQTLLITLSMTEDEDASFVTMLDAYSGERHREIWESGRYLAELDGSLASEELATQMTQMEQTLMIDRNQNWIEKLRDEVRPGNTVIAVGAAHLGGEQGVLNLLAGEGYTLTRVE